MPVPSVKSTLVRELFEELGVLRDGVWDERYLCFSPQERLFIHGEWQDGIEPDFALDAAGRAAFSRFDQLIARASGERRVHDPDGGRRATRFAAGPYSMAEWLAQHRLDAPALRWYIDYACRDDYGALARTRRRGPASTTSRRARTTNRVRSRGRRATAGSPSDSSRMLADHIRPAEPAVRIERAVGGAACVARGDDEGERISPKR